MLKKVLCCVIVVGTAACEVQSQDSFDAKPYDADQVIPRNYQAAYADVVKGARNCWGSGPQITALPQATELDANLYPDLGYGEVYHYSSGTVFMPRAYVRLDKAGDQTRVRVKVGPVGGADQLFRDRAVRWAGGDVSC
ncbi:hypothetical protein [Paracoccus sp. (in: a-proteobacteria)]